MRAFETEVVDIDPFCDHTDPQVVALADEFSSNVPSGLSWNDWEKAYAVEAFAFVRDEIKYKVLHNWTVPVSYTLNNRHGNCGTKACLLVALLRAVGIEAEFCVEKIDTTDVFFFVPRLITEKCNGKSIHFSAAVKLMGDDDVAQWYHVDATTDWELATGMSGVASDTFMVEFDGDSHAVAGGGHGGGSGFGPSVKRRGSIEDYMNKSSRVSPHLRQCFNLAADVCRKIGKHHRCRNKLAQAAEDHLIENHTEVFLSAVEFPVVRTPLATSTNNNRQLIANYISKEPTSVQADVKPSRPQLSAALAA
mmetsp:Transcript_15105/g.33724  ORF Transcript_15105/g.33724 Transcript_15105/m.33724 type:complete len:307 (+) Transcript_15105:383-1303(+)|eukprot:CAMPEP_0178481442 /NCGR_PEP_ID=MMETSP0696-20121128/6217_1 /TAXON_ID=265572 /ORGANISM="Extubocellulus spinifer, Strain CCMP396" /LENGTH=306 /DNA_ID=CAMNT_0020108921 /DNA_START=1019 /DNA_END=1939 /DNA_ORIENTATION=+